jgi:hypothetical protein
VGFPAPVGAPSLVADYSRTGATTRKFPVPSSACGVPAAAAYSMNFIVIPPAGGTVAWLSAWQDDAPWPGTVVLNDLSGGIVDNADVVEAGADGGIQVFVTDPTDLIIDINGYFLAQTFISFKGAWNSALTYAVDDVVTYSDGIESASSYIALAPSQGVNPKTDATSGGAHWAIFAQGGAQGYPGPAGPAGATGTGCTSCNFSPSLYSILLGDAQEGTASLYGGNTFLGYHQRAVPDMTTGYYNTAIGFESQSSVTTGFSNTSIGVQTLSANVTGSDNVAIGHLAGVQVTNVQNVLVGSYAGFGETGDFGEGNVAVGYEALRAGGNGSENVAVGKDALAGAANAGTVTAIGDFAMESATDAGTEAVAVGYMALQADAGEGNTGVGHYAMNALTTGAWNTGVGKNVLVNETTGGANSALGANAGALITTGSNNVAIGQLALGTTQTGSNNVTVGLGAGYQQSLINNSVLVGYHADASAPNVTNAIAIGYQASVGASNTTVIGNASTNQTLLYGNVSIGGGTNILYRCTAAGALRVGQTTTVSADCGTAVDTGLRVN